MNLDGGVHEIPLPAPVTGRLWLCGKHAIGPAPEALLDRVGAGAVVCLNEVAELDGRYPAYVEWLRRQSEDRAIWHPIPDLHAPDLDTFDAVLVELVGRFGSGDSVVVHCGAGMGRAGTTAVAILLALGLPLDAALERVRRHRPGAGPETRAQLDFVERLAAGAS